MPGKRHFRFLVIATLAALVVTLAVALPGVSADGDEDPPPPTEELELEYPNLGSRLDQLVTGVEEGEATAEDAAGDAPVHRAESVAATIYLSGNLDGVVTFLEDNGGDPRNVGEDYIEAYVPVALLGQVSVQPGVLRVREIVPAQEEYGNFTSQGVQAHLSAAWNQAGYSGQGIKVGVIDGYFGFRDFGGLMGTELPATVLARCYAEVGQPSDDLDACGNDEEGSNHGTLVAETVMDIAPDVSLYIASPLSLGDSIDVVDWMISQGVKVIVRSESHFFDGPGDGTSPSSDSPLKTVDRAVDGGMTWVNSAGNRARQTWFGEYSDANGNGWIEFSGTDPGIDMQLEAGGEITVQLRWEGSWLGEDSDFNLFVVDDVTNEPVARSEDPQSGEAGHFPYERLRYEVPSDGEYDVFVQHVSGSVPDWIQVMVRGVGSIQHATGHHSITSPGEGKNSGMLAVGAAPWYDLHTIESYSSRGPTPDGWVKPDIVGATCGETALQPLNEYNDGFCGTSQAAPHVAGLAALVKQRFPSYTPAQVASYLKDHAQQRETPHPNNTWGHGFAQLPSPDREVLEALYNATGGANWKNNDGWLTNAPIGQWHGVTTDSEGRVTELNLTSNQLKGEIPPKLASLTNLEVLALGGNELTGKLPAELGSLANLVELYLWDNELTGVIPTELGSLGNLVQLQLSGNQLTGPIPDELGSLTNLTILSLWGNELTGEIPVELGSLANLERLSLSENQLTGPIPDELGSLSNLELLSLSANQLTGEIPVELGSLAKLEVLALGGNELTGKLPAGLGSLAKLEELYLWENELTGTIPAELGSLAKLERLSLSGNQLTGPIPTSLGGLTNLEGVYLWGNELTGTIPAELGSLANLVQLQLSENQLTGTIPSQLGSLATLEALALDDNELTGAIPSELGSLTNLQELHLIRNQLSGAIPAELGSLTKLTLLRLENNQLSGVVPQTLAELTMLERFSYYNNPGLCAPVDDVFQTWLRGISIVYGSSCAQADSPEDRAVLVQVHSATGGVNWKNNAKWLSGDLTREWYGVTNDANGRVNGLFLGDNQLTGEIPAELGSLTKLEWVSLNHNQLTGEIPSELDSLANLRSLSLRDNQLSGEIPPELGSLANLERLRLSNNQLTGEIPAELGRLTNLTVLYLSGNQLTGCVPASLRDVPDNDFAQVGLPFCTSGDPLITRYDADNNGKIEKNEVIAAINDYLFGGATPITKADVIKLINLYLFG